MATNKQDTLARAYAMLSSLRKNIDQMTDLVPETYVREFHAEIARLEEIGLNVFEFHIPDSEVAPRVTSFNTLSGGKTYSEEKYVERSFILTKLDAILGYFEIIIAKKPPKMGYPTPNTK